MSLETTEIKQRLQNLKTQVDTAPIDDTVKNFLKELLSYQVDMADNLDNAESYLEDDVPCVKVSYDALSGLTETLKTFFANGPHVQGWFITQMIEIGVPQEKAMDLFMGLGQMMGVAQLQHSFMAVDAYFNGQTVEEYMAAIQQAQQQAQAMAQGQPPAA
jgi:phage-related protein